MGKYAGTVEVPAGVVITRDRGCQFQSSELGQRGIRCGQTAGLSKSEATACRACINFYYIHTEDIQVRERSEYSHFETF
jgi:hypothetical protein